LKDAMPLLLHKHECCGVLNQLNANTKRKTHYTGDLSNDMSTSSPVRPDKDKKAAEKEKNDKDRSVCMLGVCVCV